MKIKKAQYLGTAVNSNQYPRYLFPEIAFLGRSNVGKSSLINLLTNNNKLARISKSPGKTKTINFFLINDSFFFVDLPGYGYANISKECKKNWKKMIEEYFEKRKLLLCVILLFDIRRVPSEEDYLIINYLNFCKIKIIIVFTKIDKLSKIKIKNQIKKNKEALNLKEKDIVMCSAFKKLGINFLLNKIECLFLKEI